MSQVDKQETELRERCPRCGTSLLRRWSQLSVDEQDVARRLHSPAAARGLDASTSLWCTNCWYEKLGSESRLA